MKAVILAAGIGTRLRPITLEKPKAAVTVDSKPILYHQLDAYTKHGVDEIYVIAGYKSDYLKRLCDDYDFDQNVSIEVIENEIYANTENMYSLYQAADAVRGDQFFLSNGDVVFAPDIISRINRSPEETSCIAVDQDGYLDEAMKVTTNESGTPNGISKSISEDEAYAISTDIYFFSEDFSEELFNEIEYRFKHQDSYSGWTEKAIDDILGKEKFQVVCNTNSRDEWVEIDDIDDLNQADKRFSHPLDLMNKDAVFFDCDGTLYLDDEPIDGTIDLIEALEDAGVDVYYMSNNSSRWKDEYIETLNKIGIEAPSDQILLSTDGVIGYLNSHNITDTYVVGTETMRNAIEAAGINPTSDSPTHVIVGFDKELNYEKVRRATLAIRNGARFLVAHDDMVCPTEDGMVPDCGAISALVEAATGQLPSQTFGKPNVEMISHVLSDNGYEPQDIAIVGDRLRTDIQLAENINCDSVCVLTGDTKRSDIETEATQPTVVLNSVADLYDISVQR